MKTTMSSCSTTLQSFEGNGIEGNPNAPCPFHGCKRVYTDASALESHARDHAIPSESLPGKSFNCSTVGCSCSFPNMQKLMEHVRRHHKPNIYFLCENCRTKLRSYRGLLTHLHTCSKVPRGKMKSTEQTPLQPVAVTNPNATPPARSSKSASDGRGVHSAPIDPSAREFLKHLDCPSSNLFLTVSWNRETLRSAAVRENNQIPQTQASEFVCVLEMYERDVQVKRQ